MIKQTKTPEVVCGYSSLAINPATGENLNKKTVFTYNPETNHYMQGGDFNKAVQVKSITTCDGRPTGFYKNQDIPGNDFIIDSPMQLITPEKGEYKIIDSLLTAFTTTDNIAESKTQKELLITWLQHAVKAVYTGNQTAAPVLIFQPQDGAPAGNFIVENIIKPLLGNIAADMARYYPVTGESGHVNLTAQGESACLLYDPDANFRNLSVARASYILTLFKRLNHAVPVKELIYQRFRIDDYMVRFSPIYRGIIESRNGLPFLELQDSAARENVCILYVCAPTLLHKKKALNALAEECRAELPAFLHYLLNEVPDTTPAGYISPSALRIAQKAQFLREKSNNAETRAFYKACTILTLAQDTVDGVKTVSRESALDLYRYITLTAKEYNIPLPLQEWTLDSLKNCLAGMAKKYPAYVEALEGGGWLIHLAAMEKDILLSC